MAEPGGDPREVRGAAWAVPGLLVLYLLSQYLYVLAMPFINDDYVFLDVTRTASFGSLWLPARLVWLWYRPWSRELHYWTLQRLFGADVLPWHLASLALWLAVMLLYGLLARRLAGGRAAAVSIAGVAALAAWGVPLAWIAGVQDLWMMTFALGALLAFERGRTAAATALFLLALLSKETAALLPLAVFVLAWRVQGRPAARAARRVAPLVAVAVAWAAVHPLLGGRLWGGVVPPAPPLAGEGPASVALRTLLATVNLHRVPRPEFGWGGPLLVGAVGALCLVALVVLPRLRGGGARGPDPAPVARARGLVPFAAAWAVAGWAPLFMPSVAWHAYYGLFGMLGAWLLIGAALARRPAWALALVVALALLRPLNAATASRDWGDEWYQRRAAEFLDFMRQDLLTKVPRVAPHSRLFFLDVPSNVGFLQGDGPALRLWYRDPTVSGGLLSQYRVKAPGAPAGPDRFFRYDSVGGWIELGWPRAPLAVPGGVLERFREDHERLAIALSRGEDWPGAAAEYARLAASFPDSVDYAYYAGLGALAAGDSIAARAWLARAAALPGADDEIRQAARRFGVGVPAAPRGSASRGARR
jgi:hypothetical protein